MDSFTKSLFWRRLVLPIAILGSSGIGFFVGSTLWVDNRASGRIFQKAGQLPKLSVAIVPGARVYEHGVPSPALADRLHAALTLYRQGVVSKILVSGDHRETKYDEVNAMYRWLRKSNVPKEAIYLDHAGFRTFDTMVRAARVFKIKRAIICTQAFHLPRSIFLARRAGIDAYGFVADRRDYPAKVFNDFREFLAKGRAVLDSYILGTEPTHLGPSIPIDGPSSPSFDRYTRAANRRL